MRIEIPRDVSLDGHLIDGAFRYLTVASAIALAIMIAILFIAVVFHRSRGGRRLPVYTHGNRPGNNLLTLLTGLTMFAAVDMVLAVRSARDLRAGFWNYPVDDPAALRVEVMARQWSWTFRTAGPDARFNTPDDVVTLGELHVPMGRPVYLKLRAKDVVHSLYLPNFRTKIDAVPGNTTRLWFQAQETGTYEIACAQHCGVNHYKMRGELLVHDPAAYETWARRAEHDARLRYDPADAEAHDGWDWQGKEKAGP